MSPNLMIPDSLQRLIESGAWPTTPEQYRQQELEPILGEAAAKAVSPDDDRIVLSLPPFRTIQQEADHNPQFWLESLTNVGQIDYSQSLVIADFGLGSDSAIVLNYELGPDPRVLYLRWSENGPDVSHEWVCTHDSFDEFATAVGLL